MNILDKTGVLAKVVRVENDLDHAEALYERLRVATNSPYQSCTRSGVRRATHVFENARIAHAA